MSEIAAIIGGTGVYDLGRDLHSETVRTPYGEVTVERDETLVFLNRHAPGHSVPPHKVNYRANIKALELLGVKRICATFAVGAINPAFELGVPVILDDFLDMTSGREHTFYDQIKGGKGHVDVSKPFAGFLGAAIEKAAAALDLRVRRGGVYVATNGPRFESPAEIRAYRKLGGDVVGMTLCPELPLALEAGMAYAGFAFAINWGAGMTDVIELVDVGVEDIKAKMLAAMIGALEVTRNEDVQAAPII